MKAAVCSVIGWLDMAPRLPSTTSCKVFSAHSLDLMVSLGACLLHCVQASLQTTAVLMTTRSCHPRLHYQKYCQKTFTAGHILAGVVCSLICSTLGASSEDRLSRDLAKLRLVHWEPDDYAELVAQKLKVTGGSVCTCVGKNATYQLLALCAGL
jgi:hypothetical protein